MFHVPPTLAPEELQCRHYASVSSPFKWAEIPFYNPQIGSPNKPVTFTSFVEASSPIASIRAQ
jgi:hypothetical protein